MIKKFIILFLTLLILPVFYGCHKEDSFPVHRPEVPNRPNDKEDTDGPDTSPETPKDACEILELYTVKMRRELPYPFDAYVLRLSDGKYYYLSRLFLGTDLHIGDIIRFRVYKLLPDEISRIEFVSRNQKSLSCTVETRNFVAGDPIEATVVKTFELGVRYSLTFVPVKSVFILTTDDNLVYTKKFKLDINLKANDRIVYNVYRLFPNEILAIKKL